MVYVHAIHKIVSRIHEHMTLFLFHGGILSYMDPEENNNTGKTSTKHTFIGCYFHHCTNPFSLLWNLYTFLVSK